MSKDKTELEEFMGDLAGSNNADPLENKSEDPFNHLEKKEEVIEEEVKEDKPLPFNKDPKIQKYLDKREREIEERIKSSIQSSAPTTQGAEDDFKDVMDSLTTAIGNDTPEKVSALNAFKSALTNLDRRASEKAIAHIEEIQARELAEDREAEEELENAFDSIEESYDVDITSNNPLARKTRQEFVSYVERIAPKDGNGDIKDYPDMNAAWEDFSERKKLTAPTNRAKELASRSMSRSAETSSEPILKRGRTPFSNSDDFIESLSR